VPPADVLVIGGGVAGLSAAGRLAAAGRRVLLVEARPRLGGRIHTLSHPELAYPIELGAEFLQCYSCDLFKTVTAVGLAVVEVLERHEHRDHGRRSREGDPVELLDRLLQAAGPELQDRPVEELLRHQRHKLTPAEVETVTAYIEGFHAADLKRLGSRDLAENQAAEARDGDGLFRLRQGFGALVRHLAAQLPPGLVEVRTGVVVTEVRWRPGQVQARVSSESESINQLEAPQAIVTLPLGVLKAEQDRLGAVRFEPEPLEWRRALATLDMGAAERIVLHFDQSWWMELGRAPPVFMHGRDEPFPVWWTASPPDVPLLTGWIGGPRAEALAGRDPNQLVQLALQSAAKVFGRPRAALADRLKDTYHHDWSSDPFSRGAYSYGGVGAATAREVLARPVEGTLFLAGEATESSGRNATVHGAIATGLRAAESLLVEPAKPSQR
jgi:monoamine oxidase